MSNATLFLHKAGQVASPAAYYSSPKMSAFGGSSSLSSAPVMTPPMKRPLKKQLSDEEMSSTTCSTVYSSGSYSSYAGPRFKGAPEISDIPDPSF
uniref:Uncharacterized protein n=1 Tax=Chromera velia CCMP2878 TaxID=1169474 RepID=A0A0G4FTD0_9ALVE|eukprot:Cvel_18662.t1-p1 / transcript=Cvel_18662.t1 / gene=Cvel_18662 / organism=Chromera_velia_CCMP2878 / gene_product=hypothetical protein / transcript_product=hypothetical protein / location=Cvel_scaffold1560:14800-15468(+) / protein_length=94 / sequence_SO=supercontig / SO=protein_coding / is_pseudo=false